MDDKTKAQRIEEIRARITQSPIKDEDGKDGVLLSYTLSNGHQVGVRSWGAFNEKCLDLCVNQVAHSAFYHEGLLEGGAA